VKTRIRDLGDLNLVDVDLQCLTIFFKGAILKDEVVFGSFKEDDFKYETKFHIFIRSKPTKLEVAQNQRQQIQNRFE
jgi:hypothetical protein